MVKQKKYKEKGQTAAGRSLRGGFWNNQSDNLRCAARDNNSPDNNWIHNGFRVVALCAPNRTYRQNQNREKDLMPVFHGTPDWCPGMTYGPFSCGHASPLRSQPEYKNRGAALVST